MRKTTLVVFLACSFCLAADEPKAASPKSPAAKTAIAKHAKAVTEATKMYESTKQKADQELLAELKKAQADALKSGGATALAEGNAIQAVIDSLQQDTADLRRRLINTKWTWPDKNLSKDQAWFFLGDDQTTRAGWHELKGVWSVRADGTCIARISTSGEPSVVKFAANGKELIWPSGKISTRIE